MNHNRSYGAMSPIIVITILIVFAIAGAVYGSWHTTAQLSRSVASLETAPYSETRLQRPSGG